MTAARVLDADVSSSSSSVFRPLVASDRAAERVIRERVAEAVSRALGDGHLLAPTGDDEHTVRTIIDAEVATLRAARRHDQLRPAGRRGRCQRRLFDGFWAGILQPLMDDPRVGEIIINGPLRIFAIRDGRKEPVSDVYFDTDEELRNLIKRIVSTAGRRLDEAAPMVDVRLRDGSRLNAVIPPAATRWTSVTVRKFAMRVHSLAQLVELGALPSASS